eukprot:scaffold314705_cov33-Tisochrysis_lutea.AAC.2
MVSDRRSLRHLGPIGLGHDVTPHTTCLNRPSRKRKTSYGDRSIPVYHLSSSGTGAHQGERRIASRSAISSTQMGMTRTRNRATDLNVG